MSSKLSLMGRGSRAGGNCNTIEKLRGAAGNASRKIIIFFERPRTGQVMSMYQAKEFGVRLRRS